MLLCASLVRAQEDPETPYLASGLAHYGAKQFPAAVRDYRVARFLSLDRPARQLRVLAALAVAEDAAGMASARNGTLDRFVEVENRFEAFDADYIEPDIRDRFTTILLARYPKERVLANAALAGEDRKSVV